LKDLGLGILAHEIAMDHIDEFASKLKLKNNPYLYYLH